MLMIRIKNVREQNILRHIHTYKCTHVGSESQSLSIGQCEQLVVVQHAVEVLHPLRVHVPIKDDPLTLVQLSPHVVQNPEADNRKKMS